MKAATEFNLFVSSLSWKQVYIFFFVAISSYFLEFLRHMEYKAISTCCSDHIEDQSSLKHWLNQGRRIKSGTRLSNAHHPFYPFFPFFLFPLSLTTQQCQWAISGPDVTMRNNESRLPGQLSSFPLWLHYTPPLPQVVAFPVWALLWVLSLCTGIALFFRSFLSPF